MILGRLPYTLGFKILQMSLNSLPLEMWARNSFITEAFLPFKSDLDLTLWFEKQPDDSELESLWRTYSRLKKLIPFLGEINLHVRDEAKGFVNLANPFELKRDPKLPKKLDYCAAESSRADETVFLLRMLDADARNIKTRPDKRVRKWRYHLAQVGAAHLPEPLSLESIVTAIIQRSPLANDEKATAVQSLLVYFEVRADGKDYYDLTPNKDLMTFLPHYYCYHRDKITAFSGARAEISIRQLSWEVWGLSSQFRLFLLAGQKNLHQHLENLIHFTSAALSTHPRSGEISEAFAKLNRTNRQLVRSV